MSFTKTYLISINSGLAFRRYLLTQPMFVDGYDELKWNNLQHSISSKDVSSKKDTSSIQIMYQTLAEAQWRQHSCSLDLEAVVELLPKLLRLPTPLFSLQQHVLSNILYQPNFLSLPSGHLVFSCLGEKQKLIHFINYPYNGFKSTFSNHLSHQKAKRMICKMIVSQ